MKKINVVMIWISLCLLVTTVTSIAEETKAEEAKTQNKMLVLSTTAKEKLSKAQLAELKKKADSIGIPILQAATLPANQRIVCHADTTQLFGLDASSWAAWLLCDTEDFCSSVMVAVVIDAQDNRIECSYNCGSPPNGGTCNCSLGQSQPAICPQ